LPAGCQGSGRSAPARLGQVPRPRRNAPQDSGQLVILPVAGPHEPAASLAHARYQPQTGRSGPLLGRRLGAAPFESWSRTPHNHAHIPTSVLAKNSQPTDIANGAKVDSQHAIICPGMLESRKPWASYFDNDHRPIRRCPMVAGVGPPGTKRGGPVSLLSPQPPRNSGRRPQPWRCQPSLELRGRLGLARFDARGLCG
jgi:hypothetical protein